MTVRTRAAQVTWLNVRMTLKFIETARTHVDDDLVSALIVAGVLSANVEALDHRRDLPGAYQRPGGYPDRLRRPVNAMSVALSLGVPRETARVKIKALLESGILTQQDRGIVLSSNVLLSEPFTMALSGFLSALTDFVHGLGLVKACGVSGQTELAQPSWITGGTAARLATNHILRGVDYSRTLDPTIRLSTHYIFLIISHLTGACFRIHADSQQVKGRLEELNPRLGPVALIDVAEYARLPYQTVRRHVNVLLSRGSIARSSEGLDLAFHDPCLAKSWLNYQARILVSTQQLMWMLHTTGVLTTKAENETAAHFEKRG